MRKCLIVRYTHFEHKGDPNFLISLKRHLKCYEKEAKTCDVAILRHSIANLKAVVKYLGEGQGEFGKMVEGILPPSVEL